MTTLTTVLGLTPMALGLGEGSELQVPMARVLIGGLLTSTLITLFFIPTLMMMVESIRLRHRKEEKLPPTAEPALG
jgi:HAE1 family hydrophobic/amphiphilic exporter-1